MRMWIGITMIITMTMTIDDLEKYAQDNDCDLTYSHSSPDGETDCMNVHHSDDTIFQQWVWAEQRELASAL